MLGGLTSATASWKFVCDNCWFICFVCFLCCLYCCCICCVVVLLVVFSCL